MDLMSFPIKNDKTFKETNVLKGKIKMAISVDLKRCPQNHHCPALKVCPVNALTQF